MSRANLIALDAATGHAGRGLRHERRRRRRRSVRRHADDLSRTSRSSARRAAKCRRVRPAIRARSTCAPARSSGSSRPCRAPGEPFNDTWGNGWEDRGGTNMWGFAAPIDAERGIAYLPIAGPAANYYGGDRPGNNAFGELDRRGRRADRQYLLALPDRASRSVGHRHAVGRRACSSFVQQRHARCRRSRRSASRAYFYVLESRDGQAAASTSRRRRCRRATCRPSGTRRRSRFPVRPPPLARVSFSDETDLVRPEDTTPEHAAACRDFMERSGGFYNAGRSRRSCTRRPTRRRSRRFSSRAARAASTGAASPIDPTTRLRLRRRRTTARSSVGCRTRTRTSRTASKPSARSSRTIARASTASARSSRSARRSAVKYDAERSGPSVRARRASVRRGASSSPSTRNTGEIAWESVARLERELAGRQAARRQRRQRRARRVTAGGVVFVGATSDRALPRVRRARPATSSGARRSRTTPARTR